MIPPAHEQQPLGHVLDCAELVRDVEDRHAKLAVEPDEQGGQRLLRVCVDAGGRLVEDQEARLGRDRLGDEGALLLAAGQSGDRLVCLRGQADAADRRVDGAAIVGRQRPEQPPAGDAAGGDDLADGGRGLDPEVGALREVGEIPMPGGRPDRLAEHPDGCRAAAGPDPTINRRSVVLPPPFGPAIATNWPSGTAVETSSSTGRRGSYPNRTASSSTASGTPAPSAGRRDWPA